MNDELQLLKEEGQNRNKSIIKILNGNPKENIYPRGCIDTVFCPECEQVLYDSICLCVCACNIHGYVCSSKIPDGKWVTRRYGSEKLLYDGEKRQWKDGKRLENKI